METNHQQRGSGSTYPYELMQEQQHALEHLHADFRWGGYGIKVMRFHHAAFPPGKIIPFHKHSEEFEFHFIAQGSGSVIISDTFHALTAGMMYLTKPNVMHYQEASADEGMNELCLRIQIVDLDAKSQQGEQATAAAIARDNEPFEGRGWGESWERAEAKACMEQLALIPELPIADSFRCMECFLDAYRAWYEGQPGLYSILKQSIINIMLRMSRGYFPIARQPLPSRDMIHFRYKLAEQFIKDNYQEPFTLELVAERVQISARQLQRIFKTHSDQTFSSYVEQVRLAHVCTQLLESSETVEVLAQQHGFSSASYLHRVFRKKYGCTPAQYRKHSKQPQT
ncbi:AraC family transcriptional regulator [Paenibacillus sp. BIHB 4019]|uniref:AraC family transcriptional regulator n=1 Tax=Paenibacillus sp. BIHB 4019 TaxID=1870819 RepID=A0A1B2DS76_9BACL|nr:helix-turn-helix domain-containing protein [Paenibacillus sp. BIHB 4019]ANY70547.1 AraC family transcriptional regulator [Paenibacillus sp. BIHB 4019]